jgi:iron-sulfur cluster insertion protein
MKPINVTDQALARIAAVRVQKDKAALRLRLTVEGGGCSGFQYLFSWDDQRQDDDTVFRDAVITDSVSLPFLEDATLDYVVNMMGEDFRIDNPNAKSGCGCGTSFSI